MALNPFSFFFDRISETEKINFTRHLGIIIKAGLPVLEGLRIIQKQTKSRGLKRIIAQLIVDVNAGRFLADGMSRYRVAFGDFFVNIVRVGETSGSLAENLNYVGEELQKSRTLKKKVRAAMIYPAILFFTTISISSFLTFYIFPKLLTAFTSLNVPLPVVTRILIGTLTFFKEYWWLLGISFVVLVAVMKLLLLLDPVKMLTSKAVLYTPVLGGLTRNINVTNTTRLLAILLKSGVRIVESLTIVASATENILYKKALMDAADEVRRGGTFSGFITKREDLFPSIFTAMVAVGESTGNLEQNLFYLSEYHAEEIDSSLRSLTALMEPLIIVVMGLIVGFVAIAVITPIYSLTQGVVK